MSLQEILKKRSTQNLIEVRVASVRSNDDVCVKAIDAEIASRPKECVVCPACRNPILSNVEKGDK